MTTFRPTNQSSREMEGDCVIYLCNGIYFQLNLRYLSHIIKLFNVTLEIIVVSVTER